MRSRYGVIAGLILCSSPLAQAQDMSFALTGEDDWRGKFRGSLTIVDKGKGELWVTRSIVFEDSTAQVLRGSGSRNGSQIRANLMAHLGAVGWLQLQEKSAPVALVVEPNTDGTQCSARCSADEEVFSRSTGKTTDGKTSSIPLDEDSVARGYAGFKGVAFVRGKGDSHKVHPSDVKQGSLGDCYLIAGLTAVAKTDPGVIKGMITSKGDDSYAVTLTDVRSWYRDAIVTVDKQFPFTGDEDKVPAFAKFGDTITIKGTKHYELWPALIEKAYAKFKGGYGAIEGGYPSTVFSFISGKTVRKLSTEGMSAVEVQATIAKAVRKGYPVCVSTYTDNTDTASEQRMVGCHCYVVWKAEGTGFRLHNPWQSSHPPNVMSGMLIKKSCDYIYIGEF
jgi:hypothetical protein